MPKTEFDSSWQDWVTTNLNRGCAKPEMYKILIAHDFDPELAANALDYWPPGLLAGGESTPVNSAKPVVNGQGYQGSTQLTELRDRVDPPFAVKHATDKLELFVLDDFLSEQECTSLIDLVREKLRRSTTTNDSGEYANYRISKTCDLGLLDHPLSKAIDRRICQVMGIAPSYSEDVQAQWYDVGEEFKPHTDYFEPGNQEFEEHAVERGQRTWTFMVYLNNTRKGGATAFTRLGEEFRPRRGRALIWNNLKQDGTLNIETTHWGTPVEEGFKVIITKWFRACGQGPMFTKTANEYLPPLTQKGFLKSFVPRELFHKIRAFYKDNRENTQDEKVEGFINAPGDQLPSKLVKMPQELKTEIHQVLQPSAEAWIGDFLEPTYVFGIRRYLNDATLKPHRDRGVTHVVSVIVNVDQEIDEPWPLLIEDHFGRHYNIFLQPGEMIFYEGARLLHGRPQPFSGKVFANLFVHYKLSD